MVIKELNQVFLERLVTIVKCRAGLIQVLIGFFSIESFVRPGTKSNIARIEVENVKCRVESRTKLHATHKVTGMPHHKVSLSTFEIDFRLDPARLIVGLQFRAEVPPKILIKRTSGIQ